MAIKRFIEFNDIRSKIVISFIIIIAILLLQIVYLLSVHFHIVDAYKEISDNIILENKFTYYVPEFAQSYYNLVNLPYNKDRIEKYNYLRSQIEEAFNTLDASIVSDESKIYYRGLKSYVMNIVNTGDQGIRDIENGELIESIKKYEDIVSKQSYLIENVGNLIFKELSYAEDLQMQIDQTHATLINTMIVMIIILSGGCFLFAIILAKNITSPIVILAETATRISEGNLKVNVSKNLIERKDEIGTLSKSFNTMLNRLNTEIDSQKKISASLLESRKDIEAKNKEMEKFNKLAVGRELKMIELKKRIKDLEDNGKK